MGICATALRIGSSIVVREVWGLIPRPQHFPRGLNQWTLPRLQFSICKVLVLKGMPVGVLSTL